MVSQSVADLRWLIAFHIARVEGELFVCVAFPHLAETRSRDAAECAKRAWTYAWALFAAESPGEYLGPHLKLIARSTKGVK